MKDYLVMVLICSLCSFFSNGLFGQQKVEKHKEEVRKEKKDRIGQNLTVNVNDNNGIRSNEVVMTDEDGNEETWEWQGQLPDEIRDELAAAGVDVKQFEDGSGITTTVDKQVVRNSGKNRKVQVQKSGQETEVTIANADGSEQSFKWRGEMPASIAESLHVIDPKLVKKLGGAKNSKPRFSLGMQISRTVEVIEDGDTKSSEELNIVAGVTEGGPAEKAGLVKGDQLLLIDEKPITGGGSIRSALRSKSPGDAVKVTFMREGEQKSVNLILQEKS